MQRHNRMKRAFQWGMMAALTCLLACRQKAEKKTDTPPAKPAPAVDIAGPNVGLVVTGTVLQTSVIPKIETLDYDDVLTTVKLAVDQVHKGSSPGKEILVQLLAVRDRRPLPASRLKKGDNVLLHLKPFGETDAAIQSIQQVDDVNDFNLKPYFAVAHKTLNAVPIDPAALKAEVDKKRQEEIGSAIAVIEEERQQYGNGSFDKWFDSLKEFYDDVQEQIDLMKPDIKGPPKKKGMRVYGALHQELLSAPAAKHPAPPQILKLAKALEERGIDLLYVSIPRPHLIYPDFYSDVTLPHNMVAPRYREVLHRLLTQGQEVLDTFPYLMAHRETEQGLICIPGITLHPINFVLRDIAAMVAKRLERYHLNDNRYEVYLDVEAPPFHGTPVRKVVSAADGSLFAPSGDSPVLLMGDSTIRQHFGGKSCGFPAHLAKELGFPITLFQRNGMKLTDVAKADPGLLDGKRVVVWVEWTALLNKPFESKSYWQVPIQWNKSRLFGPATPPEPQP